MPEDSEERSHRGRPVLDGVLAGHYRQGGHFTPRIMAMRGSMANDWVRDDLPDLLWPLCLVALHGDSGAVYFRELQELVIDVVGADEIDELDIAVDGRLTSIERIPVEIRDEIIEALRRHYRFAELLSGEILGVVRLYDDLPGRWLLVDPWHDVDADDDEASMNQLGGAIVKVVGDRHLNALVKVTTFGWLILTSRLHMPAEAGEVLIDYPVNEEKRGAADAMILSSFLSFKAMDVEANASIGEQRDAWAARFWNANRGLSACMPEDEVQSRVGADEVGPAEADADTGSASDGGDSAEGAAGASDDAEAQIPSGISIGELVENYQIQLGSVAGALSDAFYDPDLKLNLYRPARLEVIAGLATRAIRGVAAVIRAPLTWTGENGAGVMRMLFETRVVLLWLLAQDDEAVFELYQEYGRGKRKLHKRHLQAVAEELGESTPDELVRVIEMLETQVGGEWAEEFQEVSVESTFSGKNLRTMANEVDELDSYNLLFQNLSGVTHGEWWALEEYALQRCLNPLHRFHMVPDFDLDAPEPEPRFPGLLLHHLEDVLAIAVDGLVATDDQADVAL